MKVVVDKMSTTRKSKKPQKELPAKTIQTSDMSAELNDMLWGWMLLMR